MLEALKFAHEEIKKLIQIQKELISEVKIVKREIPPDERPQDLATKLEDMGRSKIKETIRIKDKKERRSVLQNITAEITAALCDDYPESDYVIANKLYDIEKEETRNMMLKELVRLDGRKPDEIRQIICEVGYLPRTHGSAIFTRGQTQSLGTTTLGTKMDEQLIDALEGESYKAYMLHYNFPPFCTGEAKPIRGTSRREVGHGNLAERAFKPVLPKESDFPYTIRIVSDILESNGSSSMATVCSASLALMDAGVPIKASVAGIAMGLIKEDDQVIILSDILGDEDHLGDMDFKIAGTRKGITAIQMDIKIKGISYDILADALQRAKQGRLYILEKMDETLSHPREELSPFAPRIAIINLPVEKIGMVIGPGGKTIKKIIDQTGVKIDIDNDGMTTIAHEDLTKVQDAKQLILAMIKEPEVGDYYKAVVKRITNFGAFVEISPGKEGMIHISEMDVARTNKITDVVNVGDSVDVLVKRIDSDGKISLSRKEYLIKSNKK